jgi:hypothetical protein
MVDPMPNKHRYRPISIRLPEASRLWLLAFAERTEQPLNQILTEAVTDWLNTNDDAPPALPPAPAKKRPRKAAPVAAELAPQDGCPHPNGRVHKGMCGACGTGGLT